MAIKEFWALFMGFINTHNVILRILLTALLVLAAVFGSRLYRILIEKLRARLFRFMPEWLRILFDGFSGSLVLLLRAFLIYLAVLAFPLPLTPQQTALLAGPVFNAISIALLGLGFWRSEALCGLLLRSAQPAVF